MRAVRVAALKAQLSEFLRAVRRGHTVVVYDRDTPIARIVPYTAEDGILVVRSPIGGHGSLQAVPLPAPDPAALDIVDLLLEERQPDR